MAVRQDGKETVETTSSSIYLIPTALYEIVDGRSTQTIDGLVEDIMETMQKAGVDPTKISGGVDLSNKDIQRILGIEHAPHPNPASGHFRGLPSKSLETFIHEQA